MRIFISYSSCDRAAAEHLARSLRARGVEPWLDQWEIVAGSDIVSSINRGLEQADGGVILFSRESRASRWVDAEVSFLTLARIEEGKVLIPVCTDADAYVPPLLRPLARRHIDELDAIVEGLTGPRRIPSAAAGPAAAERVRIALSRTAGGAIDVEVTIGSVTHGAHSVATLPASLDDARENFLRGWCPAGLLREVAPAEGSAEEANLLELGRELRALCLPEGSGEALVNLLDGCPIGTTVEVCFASDDAELLALPFDALRLPDDRALAMHDAVTLLRSHSGLREPEDAPLPGPLKILVAVGAPDEDQTSNSVLDAERELQFILDAVEAAQRLENVEVRILEVGHPEEIGRAIERDAYHVLHLSCHGMPGALELEDEEGRAVRTTADQLIRPIRAAGRPLPLVFLNSCHGGTQLGVPSSLAESLLRAGVRSILAMQTAVTDAYGAQLARAFYTHLARQHGPLPSRALAAARKEIERERLEAIRRHAAAGLPPEYATPALFVAGRERPIADFAADKEPLRVRPATAIGGPVPQLRMDDLIGRRKELRRTLRALRDPSRSRAGVQLTGIGGVGKSAVAGRAMERLSEEGWMVAAHVGKLDVGELASAVGAALLQSADPARQRRGSLLVQPQADDDVRMHVLAEVLAKDPLVLVLDDFEQNLTADGSAFRHPQVGQWLLRLAGAARRGRLLVTSRPPVPGADAFLERVRLGPLTEAETRKLVQRLTGIREMELRQREAIRRTIGGHPRILELLDALLRGGSGRLPHVTAKLRLLTEQARGDVDEGPGHPERAVDAALLLGMRDVFLGELLEIARSERIDAALLQTAVSNLPLPAEDLARMLDGDAPDVPAAVRAIDRLADLTLLHRFPDGTAWAHRWTAEGLARLVPPEMHRASCLRAANHRLWQVEQKSARLSHGVEAARNFLAARDFESAASVAARCLATLANFRQHVAMAAFASEMAAQIPPEVAGFVDVVAFEIRANMNLGFSDRALARCLETAARQTELFERDPRSTQHARALLVLYATLGDLYRLLGKIEQAGAALEQALAFAERLSERFPGDVLRTRDVAVTSNLIGDVHVSLGRPDAARDAFLKALAIHERVAEEMPDHSSFHRDRSVCYVKLGDVHRSLGQEEQARDYYLRNLAFLQDLVERAPERLDYQGDLAVAYDRVGAAHHRLGETDAAFAAYKQMLEITQSLCEAEPDDVAIRRQLSVAHTRMGDLLRDLHQYDTAHRTYVAALQIRERIARAEPDRADYHRDLAAVCSRLSTLHRERGEEELARGYEEREVEVMQSLAEREPDRADYQYDWATTLARAGRSRTPEGKARLERALSLLLGLKERGRLMPAHEPAIAAVRKMLEDRS